MHQPRRAHRPKLRVLSRPRGGSAGRPGFTLVEVMLAMMLLTVGALALASGSMAVLRNMQQGNSRTLAVDVAQLRFEQLRSMSCGSIPLGTGTATTRGLQERWTVTQLSGTSFVVGDTITYVPRSGTTRTFGVTTVIPCVP